MVESISPTTIEKSPFKRFPSDKVMVATRAKAMSENISAGPNFSAAEATGWLRKMRNIMPIVPPINEAIAEMASAVPALPFLVIG